MCRWCAALLRLVRSVPWPFEETTTPGPGAFLNLVAGLGFDLYKRRFSLRLRGCLRACLSTFFFYRKSAAENKSSTIFARFGVYFQIQSGCSSVLNRQLFSCFFA